jgi:hypothetical protein
MMLGEARGQVWTQQVSGVVLVAFLVVPAVVRAQGMHWPEAVAELAAERTRAETCGRLLKGHAGKNTAAFSHGELAYAEARANVDAVIAGFTVALAQRGTPPDLPDVEARLTRGVQAREAFCMQVIALVPPDPGTRNPLGDLVGAFVKPSVDAVVTVYKLKTEQDRLLRQTIQTQLEATTWTPFADLTPYSGSHLDERRSGIGELKEEVPRGRAVAHANGNRYKPRASPGTAHVRYRGRDRGRGRALGPAGPDARSGPAHGADPAGRRVGHGGLCGHRLA